MGAVAKGATITVGVDGDNTLTILPHDARGVTIIATNVSNFNMKVTMLRTSLFAAVFCCLFSAGCASLFTPVVYLDSRDVRAYEFSGRHELGAFVVSGKLRSSDPFSTRYSVYRVAWFDINGTMIEQTAWRPVILRGDIPMIFKERAPVPGVVTYVVYVANDAN